jgi:hypothetical protein
MQDPAANTAPGRCDDDEVRGDWKRMNFTASAAVQ